MRVVAAAVLWREDERAGSGDRSHVSLGEEGYGGPGGHTEQGGGRVGPPVAGRRGSTRRRAEGTGERGDRLTRGILLRVTLGGNLLTGHDACTQLLLRGRSTRRHARRTGGAAEVWTGQRGPRRRQVDRDVPDEDGQRDDRVRGLQGHL